MQRRFSWSALWLMADDQGNPVDGDDLLYILARAWKDEGRLRKKLDPDGELKPIETVRGRGYRFAIPRTEG